MDVTEVPFELPDTATTDSLVSTYSVIREQIYDLSERNAQEHNDFSKEIKALDNKLDSLILTQKQELRKKEVKKFIETSDLGFEVFAGTKGEAYNRITRLWIKIPNKDQTDFDYVILGDIPEIRNYFHLKIFQGKTYNLPFFSPRGEVIISISTSAQADGNGFTPTVFHRYRFNIDTHEVTPIKDFSVIGEYFALLEIISGHNLNRICKKIDKYAHTPTDKNLLYGGRLFAYDTHKDRYRTWDEREEY